MESFSLNYVELLEYQQNRYPYLMIDFVDEVVPGKYANGYKNLTNNEWFFPSHFPGQPNMPGALQLESLAQMLTIAITTLPGNKGKTTRFVSNEMRYHKEIVPGDKMMIETEVTFFKRGLIKGIGKAFTNGDLATEAKLVIIIPDIFNLYVPNSKLESKT